MIVDQINLNDNLDGMPREAKQYFLSLRLKCEKALSEHWKKQLHLFLRVVHMQDVTMRIFKGVMHNGVCVFVSVLL